MAMMQVLCLVPLLSHALATAIDLDIEQGANFLLQREVGAHRAERSSLQVVPEVEHYWPSRGRDHATSSSVPYVAPSNFSAGPSWVWRNELKEQVRHSPLIDAQKNIYISTTTRIRKFNSDGTLLWTWRTDGERMNVCPVLHGSSLLTFLGRPSNDYKDPALVSIAMESGVEEWRQLVKGKRSSGDAKALRLYNGTIYLGLRAALADGTDTVMAVNASDGKSLWDYTVDNICWNFSPAVDERGVIFAGVCGAVYRISPEGKLLWRAGPSYPFKMCAPTGGTLGPNGLFYIEYNEPRYNGTGDLSKMVAYNATDGSLVWQNTLPYRAGQYPAVGKLGPEGPLAVLVPMADQPLPSMPRAVESLGLLVHGGPYRSKVLALDAETGAKLWQSEDRPWYALHGAGERAEHNSTDGGDCFPDAQGIPVVAGDGTVYASSSHHGDLSAIRDKNGDGLISPDEVSIFKTGKCFLNSPSLAPGMLVAAPCWGPVYVFKS